MTRTACRSRPRRVIRWTVIGTLFAALVLAASLAGPVLRQLGERLAARPRPLLATEAQTRSLLALVVADLPQFVPPPPPPPHPAGQRPSPSPAPRRPWIVAAESIRFLDDRKCCGGASESAWYLLEGWPWPAQRSLRDELLAANGTARALPLAGLDGVYLATESDIGKASESGWQFDLPGRFPASAGLLRISWPVMSPDGLQAVLYASVRCGTQCGQGRVYGLEWSEGRWRISRQSTLWMS